MLRIVNEPTAAALAYGLDKKKDETIAVYDFGGGTFDISILEVGEGVVEVKATNGDTHLGGDNLDQRVIDWIVAEFKKDQGIDLSKDKMALQRLKEAAEKAKCELSHDDGDGDQPPLHHRRRLGPEAPRPEAHPGEARAARRRPVERSMGPVQQCLKDAGVEPKDIDEVVLVGGMTRMPKIQQLVKEFFGKEPHKGVNPDEVVAVGAAIQARHPRRRGEGRPAPRRDSAVARRRDPRRRDDHASSSATPRSRPRRPRSSRPRPTARPPSRSTSSRASARWRGTTAPSASSTWSGIPPAPRGVPQVEVTFDIDANGILNVSAKDRATGKTQAITITASSGLAKDEVEKMVKDAEAHAAEDKKRREVIDLRNQADNLAYSVEKLLGENRDKVGEAEAKAIEEAIAEARKAAEGEDAAAIKAAMDELTKASHKLAEELYRQTGGPSAGPGGGRPGERRRRPGAARGRRRGRRVHGQGQLRSGRRSGGPSERESEEEVTWQSFAGNRSVTW